MKSIDKTKVRIKFMENKDKRVLLFSLILLSELFALINGNFLSTYNLVSIGQSVAPYAILSLGAMFPIALGYTDLSSGALCIGSAVVAGKLYSMGMPLFLAIPVMIVFGMLIGLLNGILVSRIKLPPFIVTLGTMMFLRGATSLFANQPNILFPTDSWYNRVFSTTFNIPVGFIWVIVIAIVVGFFFNKTASGRHLLAVGSNEKAATIAGIDTNKLKIKAFVISGMFAGIASIFWSASFATVTVATGNGMELDAIAGAYIGGCAAAGGSVSAAGSVLGALLLVIIRSGLNFVLARLDVSLNSTYVTYVITGFIVVLAVLLDKTKDSRRKSFDPDKKDSILKTYGIPAVAFVLAIVMLITNTSIFVKQQKEESNTLCVLMKSEGNAFWDSIEAGAKDAAEQYGYNLIIRGSESEDSSNLPIQRDLLRLMLSENPAGIAVSTIADGFTDLIEEAYDRNVPVIEYDSGLYSTDLDIISQSDKNPLKGFVKGDNYANASIVADKMFETLHDDIAASEKYIIGIIQHENTVTAQMRADGFADRFNELAEADPLVKGKYEICIEVKPSEKNNAYKEALEALFEKGASAVYMTAECITNQVSDAVAAAGNKYDALVFSAYDSGVKAIEWLGAKSGSRYLGGVSQNPYNIGYLTVETMVKIAQGENVPDVTIVPGVWYDSENCEELLKQMVIS